AARGADLLPGPVAEEAAPQAAAHPATVRPAGGRAAGARRHAAHGHRLGALRGTDAAGLLRRAAAAEPVPGDRVGAASGVAAGDQVRGAGATGRPGVPAPRTWSP